MEICSPNLVNFNYGVQCCHAVTYISLSLMHLFVCLFVHPSRRQQNRLTLAADISDKGRHKRTKLSRLLEGG